LSNVADDRSTTKVDNVTSISEVNPTSTQGNPLYADQNAKFSNLPTLDVAVYDEVCTMCEQASEGFYGRLYDKYVSSAKSDLESLELAIAENDAATVSSSAHRLKSGSANWGGKRMAAYCEELETNAKADNLSNANELLANLNEEYRILIAEIFREEKAA